ncbi:Tripartite ATP-independent periplasmic transporters, DctQ component [SAR116 cluster alpha proteobacterium HIMB100]|nr:Tripartite ATP-independent periplasmic transporters, DctQ component [SAR116 cluster alpha proteobacterium HIMB100]
MNDWYDIAGLSLAFWLFGLPSLVAVLSYIFKSRLMPVFALVWSVLDRLYMASGLVAAVAMISILVIIIWQMIARWVGFTFEGSTEFAGYAMAATSFFALAHAFSRGAHIRVSIFLNLNGFTRFWLDVVALFIGALTATYFARYAVKTNFMSEMLNDRTQGQDQIPQLAVDIISLLGTSPAKWADTLSQSDGAWIYTPVWVPQLVMSVGTILLAICLWDYLIRLLVTGQSAVKAEKIE